jgi:hypothetical protein
MQEPQIEAKRAFPFFFVVDDAWHAVNFVQSCDLEHLDIHDNDRKPYRLVDLQRLAQASRLKARQNPEWFFVTLS